LQWDERDLAMKVAGPDITQATNSLIKEIRVIAAQTGGSFEYVRRSFR